MKDYLNYWWSMFLYALKGSRLYYCWVGFLLVMMAWGGVCYYHQLVEGLIVTHMSDQVSWGLGVANFVYFVGVAASAVVLVYPAYIKKNQDIKKVVIIAEQLAFTAIVMCLLYIFTDIGRPDRFLHMIPLLGGRLNLPQSILAWDVVVINIYLILNLHIPGYLLYMKYMGKRPQPYLYYPFVFLVMIFAISIQVSEAFLLSGLGSRYFWNTAILAPRFIVSAFSVGPAIFYLVFLSVNHFSSLKMETSVFEYLKNIMNFTLPLNLFLLMCEVFKELYPGTLHAASAQYLYFGLKGYHLLTFFIWPAMIMNFIAACVVMIRPLRNNTVLFVIACHLCIVGLWVEKGMGLVIPGFVPTPLGEISEYYPNLDEVVLCLAITALGALMFTIFAKVTIGIITGEIHHKESPSKIASARAAATAISFLMVLGAFIFPSQAMTKEKSLVSGWVMQDYRWKTTGGDTANTMNTLVTLNVGDAKLDRFSGAIQGGLIEDLDKQNPGSPFQNVYDTFGSHVIGRLYYGYLDVNRASVFNNIRLGRQHIYELEGLHFDGLSMESNTYAGFKLSAFSGTPVHLYETQLGLDPGDWTVGGALQWTPIAKLRFRFSTVHLRDKVSAFRIFQNNTDDTLLGGSVWYSLTPHWELYSRFSSFTDQVRDVDFGSYTDITSQDMKVTVTGHRLLASYSFRVDELDPYTFAGTYQPYTEVMAQVYKGFGKKFSAVVGGGERILDHNQIASEFNHGYDKIYGSFSTRDFLVKGLSSTTTGDYSHGRDNVLKNNYFGMSFSLNQELLAKKLILGAGTAYYLYRFNLFTGNESSDVHTYFSEVEGRVRKNLKLKATYEFEKNRINGFHSGKVRAIWNF
ncbi:MAG: polysulfide reductase NrfD [Deltaproteobacteria bacterium]|nr:MAG: polysulfide reductase NrfD [Deltaproteobacteria bacterium]